MPFKNKINTKIYKQEERIEEWEVASSKYDYDHEMLVFFIFGYPIISSN